MQVNRSAQIWVTRDTHVKQISRN